MRKYLFRIENLLLLIPLLLFCLPNTYFGGNALDIHLHDTYIVVDIYHIILAGFIFLLLPYFLHSVLRWKQKRNAAICNLHIIITIVLLAIFFVLFFISILQPDVITNDVSIEKTFQSFGNTSPGTATMVYISLSVVLLEALFVVYFWFAYFGNTGEANKKAQ